MSFSAEAGILALLRCGMSAEAACRRILFVDDEQSVRLVLPPILVKHGFDVISVGTIPDALASIQATKFDVLLSDLNLPAANAGFAVIEEMRRAQPGCINFILTGFPAIESFQRSVGQVAYYFIKPVDVEEMIGTIREKLAPRSSLSAAPEASRTSKVKYSWQRPVLDAVMEFRPDRLSFRLNAAERAICARLCDPATPDRDESAALRDALRTLRLLFPGQSKSKDDSGGKKEIA